MGFYFERLFWGLFLFGNLMVLSEKLALGTVQKLRKLKVEVYREKKVRKWNVLKMSFEDDILKSVELLILKSVGNKGAWGGFNRGGKEWQHIASKDSRDVLLY